MRAPRSCRRLARVRRAIALFVVIVGASACAKVRFETVVEIAASGHPRTCDGRFTVTQLSGSGYRVDACEGTLYYRCFYARKTMGRTQCCAEVADEAEATSWVHFDGPEPTTCEQFVD